MGLDAPESGYGNPVKAKGKLEEGEGTLAQDAGLTPAKREGRRRDNCMGRILGCSKSKRVWPG